MSESSTYTRNSPLQRKQMHYSPNLLNTIINAIAHCKLSSIEYESREKGVTLRNIEPMALVFKDRKRHLVAFCHLRNEYRSFRLDRLNLIKLSTEEFIRRPDFNVNDFQDDSAPSNEEFGDEF